MISFCAEAGAPEEGFDCIVMDPPWENASARRGCKYPSLPARKLLSIPVARLLHQACCLQALLVWLPSRPCCLNPGLHRYAVQCCMQL